jgi:ABC-2 type transport system ATP-binding protein
MDAIVVDNLTKQFGELKAVAGISFRVKKGEILGLLGPNGAGKTTTVRMLTCIIPPTGGTAIVGGHDVRNKHNSVKKIVGYLPENPSLYERLSAVENLDFYGELYDVPLNGRKERIWGLLTFFGLSSRAHDDVRTYSKGMKQKLSIAKALIHKPEILFLDEPTAGLDPITAKAVRDVIHKLAKKEKVTIIICSHNLSEVERLCTKVVIINAGKIVGEGHVSALEKMLERKAYVVEVELEKVSHKLVKTLRRLSYVKYLHVMSSNKLTIALKEKELAPRLMKVLSQAGERIFSFVPLKPTLEEVYTGLVKNEK